MKLHEATDEIEDIIQTKKVMDPIHNWFFNAEKENYSHKVIDFANARYQPTTVDIKNDSYYRSQTRMQEEQEERKLLADEKEAKDRADLIQQNTSRENLQGDGLPTTPMEQATIDPTCEIVGGSPMEQPALTQPTEVTDVSPVVSENQGISEEELAGRRAQFKALLTPQATPSAPENVEAQTPLDSNSEKRQQFRELISTTPLQLSSNEPVILNTKNRNKLKDFLSAAQASKTRKALA